jgi:cell division protein FtsW
MTSAILLLCLSAGSLMAFGLVMLYSAMMVQKGPNLMWMQAIWGVAGLIACGFMTWVDYRHWRSPKWWRSLSVWAWVIGSALLVLVLFIGIDRNGSRRWFDLHVGFFQPSEAAKLALILAIAWYIERYQRFMHTFTRGIVIPMLMASAILVPLFMEPDRGTTVLLAALVCVMLVLGGARWWHIVAPMVIFGTFIAVSISQDSVRSDRVRAWLDPELYKENIGYQQWQSMLAIGHGGVEGVGLGNGRQKLGFLPEHQTDFIYSVVTEELGLIAGLGVILGFATFLMCGVYIAWNADDLYGFLVASGVTFLIGMQSVFNMAVVTNLLPNKGLSLPFLSYGGSNLLMTLAAVGLLLSVARHRGGRAVDEFSDADLDDALLAPQGN